MMHRKHLVFALLVIVLLSPSASVPAQDAAARRAVNAVLDEFERCFLEEDVQAIGNLLAEDYVLVVTNREDPNSTLTFNKEGYLQVETHRFSAVDFVEHHHTEREIEVFGPMATSRSTIVNRYAGGHRGESRIFHAYARVDGRWQVVFSSSYLAE